MCSVLEPTGAHYLNSVIIYVNGLGKGGREMAVLDFISCFYNEHESEIANNNLFESVIYRYASRAISIDETDAKLRNMRRRFVIK